MKNSPSYDFSYTQYQADRSGLRRWVRGVYLRRAASLVSGRTLDFGCGIGELLRRLPAGSIGLEYNRDTVEFCRDRGLDVLWYDGFSDGWALRILQEERFESMVLSHVLEHFDDPLEVLSGLLRAAMKHGIRKVLVIVPGPAGFKLDPTHRCYIDEKYLEQALTLSPRWEISEQRRFPINIEALGRFFPHHELQTLLTLH